MTHGIGQPSRSVFGAGEAVVITPSDDTDLDINTRGIFVGTAGDLEVILEDMTNPVVFKSMAAGLVHPLRVKRVRAAGTTATDIIGVW